MTYENICCFISLVWFRGTENWIQVLMHVIKCSTMGLYSTLISSHKLPEAVKPQIINSLWNPSVLHMKDKTNGNVASPPSFVIKLVLGWVKQLNLAHTVSGTTTSSTQKAGAQTAKGNHCPGLQWWASAAHSNSCRSHGSTHWRHTLIAHTWVEVTGQWVWHICVWDNRGSKLGRYTKLACVSWSYTGRQDISRRERKT